MNHSTSVEPEDSFGAEISDSLPLGKGMAMWKGCSTASQMILLAINEERKRQTSISIGLQLKKSFNLLLGGDARGSTGSRNYLGQQEER